MRSRFRNARVVRESGDVCANEYKALHIEHIQVGIRSDIMGIKAHSHANFSDRLLERRSRERALENAATTGDCDALLTAEVEPFRARLWRT